MGVLPTGKSGGSQGRLMQMAKPRDFWNSEEVQEIVQAYMDDSITAEKAYAVLGLDDGRKSSPKAIMDWYARKRRRRLGIVDSGGPRKPATGRGTPSPPSLASPGQVISESALFPISVSELTEWRRRLVQSLRVMDRTSSRKKDEGVAQCIARLSWAGVIPRHVAAMMRMITELRNVVEYESKPLSQAESRAARAAWDVIQEWAQVRGLDL